MDGDAERWALLQEEGMLVPAGTCCVGRLGWPGWDEGGRNKESHCPKEIRVWYKYLLGLGLTPLPL